MMSPFGSWTVLVCCLAALAAGPRVSVAQGGAEERPAAPALDVRGVPLSDALMHLARSRTLELAYAPELVAGKTSTCARQPGRDEDALRCVLAGSDLVAQRLPNGVYVIRDRSEFAASGGVAAGTGTIVGVVVGEGDRLAGAHVRVVGTQLAAASGLDGRFSIPRVPVGLHDLEVSMIGFASRQFRQIPVEAENEVGVELALSETTLPMEEVVVTSQTAPSLATSALGALDVIEGFQGVRVGPVAGGLLFSARPEPMRGVQFGGVGSLVRDSLSGVQFGGVFSAASGAAQGVQFGGVFNAVTGDMKGVQFGGVFNAATGTARGIQYGGVFNAVGTDSTAGSARGIQFGGVFNAVSGDVRGLQFGGVFNIVEAEFRGRGGAGRATERAGELRGVQFAGGLNRSARTVYGAQVAGALNTAGDVRGVQTAGVLNVTRSLRGVQLGGVLNLARGPVTGAQIAGVVNIAGSVKGLQLGIVNVSTRNRGVPIGLVSYVKEVGLRYDVWVDETGLVTSAVRSGTRRFSNYLGIGARPGDLDRPTAVVVGLGGEFALRPRLYGSVDAFSYGTGWNGWDEERIKLRALLGFRVTPHLAVFGGPALNLLLSKEPESNTVVPWKGRSGRWRNTYYDLWPGFSLGLRLSTRS